MATKKILPKIKEISAPISLNSSLPAEIVVNSENQEAITATCDKEGLTREKCIRVISEALSATKMTLDKYGEEHEEPDHDKRLKASLAGLELRGDFKSKAPITTGSTYNTVVYQWKKNNAKNG